MIWTHWLELCALTMSRSSGEPKSSLHIVTSDADKPDDGISDTFFSDTDHQPLLRSKTTPESIPDSCSDYSSDSQSNEDNDKKLVDRRSWRKWSRAQWIILVTHCTLLFCGSVSYSLLSAFFPQEALKKGADSLTTGIIFGVYELVVFIASPIFGTLVSLK